MKMIDSHAHFAADTPQFYELMAKTGLRIINNCYDGNAHGMEGENSAKQKVRYKTITAARPDLFQWVTTFESAGFEDADFVEKTIAILEQDFADGALGVKMWKNVGMMLKRKNGEMLFLDEPLFDPIFEYITKCDKTLMIHTGEPWQHFQPLQKGTIHAQYMLTNKLDFINDPDIAEHDRYLQVFDNIMDKHPNMRVIGVHLGCMEHSLERMSQTLDKYPNFAMDTAGPSRSAGLAILDNDDVTAFLTKYQDRIMYGTDFLNELLLSQYSPEEQAEFIAMFDRYYNQVPSYYESTDLVMVKFVCTPGLGLPQDVLDKIFTTNVAKWYPGAFDN